MHTHIYIDINIGIVMLQFRNQPRGFLGLQPASLAVLIAVCAAATVVPQDVESVEQAGL